MIVILTKCIDLSVAANLALTGMVVSLINIAAPGLPIIVILLVAVGFGAILGMANGLLVWRLDIPPIVVTLGTMTIFRGTIFLLTEGKWVNSHEMSDTFKAFPRAEIIGLPVLSWFAIAAVILFTIVMTRTTLGRAFYAAGGNPHAATYAGINVGRTQFWAFTISGALAGLTGYLWVSRFAVAYVDVAGGFELTVVAACVIGGVSIMGGIGSVPGALLGALFLGIIANALPVREHLTFLANGNLGRGDHHCGGLECTGQSHTGAYHPETGGAGNMNTNMRSIPDRLQSPLERNLKSWESLLMLVAIGIFIANSFASPYFLNAWNLSDATFNFTEKAMIAFAMALLIISGEIDLSVASIIALASTAMGAAVQVGVGTEGIVLIGLAVGLVCGAFQWLSCDRPRAALYCCHHRHDEPVSRDKLYRAGRSGLQRLPGRLRLLWAGLRLVGDFLRIRALCRHRGDLRDPSAHDELWARGLCHRQQCDGRAFLGHPRGPGEIHPVPTDGPHVGGRCGLPDVAARFDPTLHRLRVGA